MSVPIRELTESEYEWARHVYKGIIRRCMEYCDPSCVQYIEGTQERLPPPPENARGIVPGILLQGFLRHALQKLPCADIRAWFEAELDAQWAEVMLDNATVISFSIGKDGKVEEKP